MYEICEVGMKDLIYIDHGSYVSNLRSCEMKPGKKFRLKRDSKYTAAIQVQCFTRRAIKSTGSWSMLGSNPVQAW